MVEDSALINHNKLALDTLKNNFFYVTFAFLSNSVKNSWYLFGFKSHEKSLGTPDLFCIYHSLNEGMNSSDSPEKVNLAQIPVIPDVWEMYLILDELFFFEKLHLYPETNKSAIEMQDQNDGWRRQEIRAFASGVKKNSV